MHSGGTRPPGIGNTWTEARVGPAVIVMRYPIGDACQHRALSDRLPEIMRNPRAATRSRLPASQQPKGLVVRSTE